MNNQELTTKVVAKKLKITRARLSQVAKLKRKELGNVKRIGNVILFTPEQVVILKDRVTKRGRVPKLKTRQK